MLYGSTAEIHILCAAVAVFWGINHFDALCSQMIVAQGLTANLIYKLFKQELPSIYAVIIIINHKGFLGSNTTIY